MQQFMATLMDDSDEFPGTMPVTLSPSSSRSGINR
eukprot:CAMPEP_0114570146 /NCGR_PEP_ID=MMETSP0114-20121206/17033_1 /TAXON_ID=31324 /ORGANISM="Goniomonas sp, Strain m" /LENGTH=34 /DNA_ID= /DNA_START= /DNA_END= /DNA_ORIENTATION=